MVKKVALVSAGVAAVIIVLALIAPLFLSSDTYKNQIISKVEALTGRTLAINGKFSITLFPVAGITAENVTLSNPAGFDGQEPFLKLASLTVDVAAIPLLHKQIVVKNFVLKDPVVSLAVSNDGKKNWIFTTKPAEPNKKIKPPAYVKPAPDKALPDSFILNNFALDNGTVVYSKGAGSPPVQLKKINATVVLQSSETAAMIDGSAELNGKSIDLKVGIGTLKSLLEEQKAEINVTIKNDLFNVSVNGDLENAEFKGKQKINASSIANIVAWVMPNSPLSTSAKLALQSDADVSCSLGGCDFSNLHWVMDTMESMGNILVIWADAKPSVVIKFVTNQLDFTPFLPQQHAGLMGNGIISEANAAEGERWSKDPIDLSVLNHFNIRAAIQTDSIKFRDVAIGKTQLNAGLHDGVVNLNLSSENFYQGSSTISATLDASQATPQFKTDILLKNLVIGPLLKDATHKDNLTGTADIQITLQSNCDSVNSFISNMHSEGQFRVVNGEIKHINLVEMLHNNQGAFGDTPEQYTAFSLMAGSYHILSGELNNRDLVIDTQGLTIGGEGDVHLPAYTIDYRLTPKLVTTGSDNATKEGISVPVIITGSLDAPKYRPDIATTIKNAIQDPKQFKDQLKNSKGALKNLKGLLQGLQGR